MKTNRIFLVVLVLLILAGGLFFIFKDKILNTKVGETATDQKSGIEKEKVTIGVGILTTGVYPEIKPELYSASFNSHTFEPLIRFNKDNKIVPVLAEKWDNPDNLTWRFYLSSKTKFSDGTPLTAEDVKFTYEYILSQKLPLAANFPEISEIKIVSPTVLEFKTKAPNPLLLNNLAINFLILSKKEVEQNGLTNNIGSGPYLLESIDDSEAKLIRNENYWGTKPKIKNAVFKVIPEEADRITALLKNEIDFTSYGYTDQAAVSQLEQSINNKNLQSKKNLDASILYMGLDTVRDKSPYISTNQNPLKNLKVREAIYKAIDIEKVLNAAQNNAVAASQIVSQGIFGYNPEIKRPSFNAEEAKKLIKEAGFGDGFNLTIDYMASPTVDPIYQNIASQLDSINIKVTLNGIEPKEFYTKLAKQDSSVFVVSFSADNMDASDALNNIIHTPSEIYGSANGGYSNPEIDKIIEEAAATLDQKIRLEKLQEALAQSTEDVAVIPLFQYYVKYALSNDILWTPRLDSTVRIYEMAGKK